MPFDPAKYLTAIATAVTMIVIAALTTFSTTRASDEDVEAVAAAVKHNKAEHNGDVEVIREAIVAMEEQDSETRAAQNAVMMQQTVMMRALAQIDANTREPGDAPALTASDLDQPDLLD
jgi:predicted S18 family serine protease